jgi:hypothetical protein
MGFSKVERLATPLVWLCTKSRRAATVVAVSDTLVCRSDERRDPVVVVHDDDLAADVLRAANCGPATNSSSCRSFNV